jgi:hypothetical protein
MARQSELAAFIVSWFEKAKTVILDNPIWQAH